MFPKCSGSEKKHKRKSSCIYNTFFLGRGGGGGVDLRLLRSRGHAEDKRHNFMLKSLLISDGFNFFI